MPALTQSQLEALTPFVMGRRVDRATATLPQTNHAAIFNVTGGRILLLGILGEVTTAIQNQANNTKLTSYPTTGTAVDMCAVTTTANKEVGSLLSIDGTVGTAMLVANAGVVAAMSKPQIIPIGAIHLDCAASNTGSVKWSLWYVPLDDGALVAAA